MRRRILTILLFLVGVVCLAIALRQFVPFDRLVENELELRAAIRSHPRSAWLIGFVIYVAVSLVPGTTGKSMIFGWLFGMWQAVLMIDCALTVAALITFLISRYALRDAVQNRFRLQLERLNRGFERDGPFYLLLLRLMHAPYTFLNYTCGALPVRIGTFWWTTQLGLLPGTIVFVFAGTRLPTLREMQERGMLQLLDPWLILALVLTALFPIIVRWLMGWWRRGSKRRQQPQESFITASTPDGRTKTEGE